MIEPTRASDSLKVSALEQGVDPLKQPGENLKDLLEFKYAAIAGHN